MAEKEIGRITKDAQTEIVIRITEFKGSLGVDIREYVTSDRYTGWSKSGLRIKPDDMTMFHNMVKKACQEVKKS